MHSTRTARLAASLTLLWATLGLRAPAQESAPGLVVTYLEAPATKAAALAADLNAYAAQIESGAGKPHLTLLTEFGRPTRMVVLEQWPDLSAPAQAEAATALAARTQSDVLAPIDRHVTHPLTPAVSAASSTAFHVLMHVDVHLGSDAQPAIVAQKEAVLAAPGALGFETAVEDKRANHFAVHEVWASRKAYEAYTATAPAEDLRRRLAPLLGSPFDERFFSAAPR